MPDRDQHTPHGLPKADRYGWPAQDPRTTRLLESLQALGYRFASWTQQGSHLVLVADKPNQDSPLERPVELLLAPRRVLFHRTAGELEGLEPSEGMEDGLFRCRTCQAAPRNVTRAWECQECRAWFCSESCAEAHLWATRKCHPLDGCNEGSRA